MNHSVRKSCSRVALVLLILLVVYSCEKKEDHKLSTASLSLHKSIQPLEEHSKSLVKQWEGYESLDSNMRICNTNAYNALGFLNYLERNVAVMEENVPLHFREPEIYSSINIMEKALEKLNEMVEDRDISTNDLKNQLEEIFEAFDLLNTKLNEIVVQTT